MFSYNLSQWVMLFFVYSFIGWIWECLYVSVRVKKLTNRGFMYGPILPLYGSAAITLLFTTLPVSNNPYLVYIVSVVSATTVELFTGIAMQALFKVRYWDYSKEFLNFRGHICLKASLFWGFAGVALVYFMNKPFNYLVTSVPHSVAELIAFFLTVVAACDFGASFREALDVRELMLQFAEERDRQIKKLGKRMDVMAAVYGNDINNVKLEAAEKVGEIKESGQELMDKTREKLMGLSRGQRVTLDRFMKANPETDSMHKSISLELADLKNYIMNRGSLNKVRLNKDSASEEND